ncbi:methyltransferase [Prosthecobacter fluviatilis]|uniref:Methyltransferase n=1 Tax=Prosthecobacter fluviatilis TaxID=445931 RepID=A0ABW0KQA6_9BACT
MHPLIDKILLPLDRALTVNIIWRPIEATLIRFSRGLRRRRTRMQIEHLMEKLRKQPEVRQGRFAGMRYAAIEATCSAVIPKLLGTYESELDSVFERVFANAYEQVVDIGCAEGYYAIGLALQFPGCHVYAFDTDFRAQELCRKNARLNKVEDRVAVAGEVTAEKLADTIQERRCLIVCDCEGFERNLFNHKTVGEFYKSDLLIETHDFIRDGISKYLIGLFANTHQVQVLHSIDDLQKAHTYESDLASNLDFEAKQLAYAEGRPVIMEWLFLTPHLNI